MVLKAQGSLKRPRVKTSNSFQSMNLFQRTAVCRFLYILSVSMGSGSGSLGNIHAFCRGLEHAYYVHTFYFTHITTLSSPLYRWEIREVSPLTWPRSHSFLPLGITTQDFCLSEGLLSFVPQQTQAASCFYCCSCTLGSDPPWIKLQVHHFQL